MDLLSPCRRQVPSPLTSSTYDSTSPTHCDSGSSNGSGSVPITPTDEVAPYSFSGGKRSTARQIFCIDILPQDDRASTSGCNGQSRFPSGLDVNSPASAFSEGVTRLSEHPRHIRTIDPTLTFVSHSRVTADCQFAVYSEGHLVFKESTVLSPYEMESKDVPPGTDGCLLYRTSLVPNYWKTISESNGQRNGVLFGYLILTDFMGRSHEIHDIPRGHSSGSPMCLRGKVYICLSCSIWRCHLRTRSRCPPPLRLFI